MPHSNQSSVSLFIKMFMKKALKFSRGLIAMCARNDFLNWMGMNGIFDITDIPVQLRPFENCVRDPLRKMEVSYR